MKAFNLKKILSVLAIATLALSVSGCAPQSQADATRAMFDSLPMQCTPMADGDAAKSISVTGDTGIPKVSFAPNLVPSKPETHVIKKGDGLLFTGNQIASFEIEAVDTIKVEPFPASTGLVTNFDGTNVMHKLLDNAAGTQVSLCDALAGQRVGARIASIYPIAAADGSSKKTSVVLVVDLKNVYLPHAAGSAQPAVAGVPSAVRVASGEPGLVFPSSLAAPKDYREYTPIVGSGPVLKKGDNVLLQYKLYLWDDAHTMVQKTWGDMGPQPFTVGSGTIKGFAKALDGKTIGSEIVAVIPPALGYGDTANTGIPANSTLVYVIDILGII